MLVLELDADLELRQVPGHLFPVNLSSLGIQSPRTSNPTNLSVSRVRILLDSMVEFPDELVTSFRVQDDSSYMGPRDGLVRLVQTGLSILMMSADHVDMCTDVNGLLAAHCLTVLLRLVPQCGQLVRCRLHDLQERMERDAGLVRQTLEQLSSGHVPTTTSNEALLQQRIVELERKNENLLKALGKAYRTKETN